MSLSAEEKRRFLKALEEDEEFRLAVAGLLGLREVLEEIRKLREDFNRYVARSEKRWRENEKKWEENEKRWEENEKRWKEAHKRFSRIEGVLAASVGAQFTRYVWEDLSMEIRASGESALRRVRNFKLDDIEVDLLVETDKRAYVVEVKVRPKAKDVRALLAKAEAIGGKLGKEAVPVLAGAQIGDDVKAYARGKGALVFEY